METNQRCGCGAGAKVALADGRPACNDCWLAAWRREHEEELAGRRPWPKRGLGGELAEAFGPMLVFLVAALAAGGALAMAAANFR
jgi:hypothetical protein